MRVGDCTLGGSDKEKLEKTISTIKNLGLNLAVIYSPTFYKKAKLSSMRDEMRVLGEIFNQKDRALKLYDYLNATQTLIQECTKNITQKRSVLYIGLNPATRKNRKDRKREKCL